MRIALLELALGIDHVLGKQARAVEVEVGVQVLGAEGIDPGGEALRDVL